MAEVMRISEHAVGDVTVLRLEGRMILEEGDLPFRACVERLVTAGRIRLVVDFSGVTYMDSAGIGMLAAKYLTVRRTGGDLKLLRLTPRAYHLLSITKLTTVFEAYESEEEAVRSFERAASPT